MERRLKERLTGAVVLLLLAIIFVPMILDNSAQEAIEITKTNIPPEPEVEFKSAVLPVEQLPPVEPPSVPLVMTAADDKAALSADNAVPSISTVTDNPANPEPTSVAEPALPPVESAPTEVIQVENQNAPAQNPSADTATRAMSAWVIQLGSFTSQANAENLVRKLQTQEFPAYIEKVTADAGIVYKVRVGPELSRPAAENIVKNLKARMNLDSIILSFP